MYGKPLCEPLRLQHDYSSGRQAVAVWARRNGEARAEFSHCALWRLP